MALRAGLRCTLNMARPLLSEASIPLNSCTPKVLHSFLEEALYQSLLDPRGPHHFGNRGRFAYRVFEHVGHHKRDCDATVELLQSSSVIHQRGFKTRFYCLELGYPGIKNLGLTRISAQCFATDSWAREPDEESEQDFARETKSEASERAEERHVDPLCPTRSPRVQQLKGRLFDDIIEREKKLKIVMKIKDLLAAEPGRSMTLTELGKSRHYIGLTGNRRIIAFLKMYPAVFQVHEAVGFDKLPWFRFTPEAEAIYAEEVNIRKNMKVEVVTKLRKLLMMSNERRHLLTKIVHLAKDLGLPDDFRDGLVHKYPKYFQVVENMEVTNEEGCILELVKWSDRLAITEAEKKTENFMHCKSLEIPPRLDIKLPKHYRRSNKDKYVLYKFHEVECPSPYQDSSHFHARSVEAEKRSVLLVQELLFLTLEKRLLVDHLTHFRKEFRFSKQIRGMLLRHPEHFYISKKGARDTVFLREAYENIHVPGQRQEYVLKEKHPLVLVKEKLAALMASKQMSSVRKSTISSHNGLEVGIPLNECTVPPAKIVTALSPW